MEVILMANQNLDHVCQEGWIKADPDRSFPTFTTSRPRSHPGRKPAGVSTCTTEELQRWQEDQYRYPPYQYTNRNTMVNKHNEHRLPSIEEKEFMMGFPIGYTWACMGKQQRNTQRHLDAAPFIDWQ